MVELHRPSQDKKGRSIRSKHNVLHTYRSYAYHHILIVCDSTTTAQALQTKQKITELQRSSRQRNSRARKFDGMSIDGGPGDNYVILIDGLEDSDFYITKAGWNTIITPQDTGQQTMSQLDGELEIFEPYGTQFLNRLVCACDTLNTDPTGLVFLLKTVFVGFNDTQHRFNQEMIPNVKPFLFYLVDITSAINETGSNYSLAVIGTQNGFGKLPHVTNIAKGFSLEINRGDTLQATLASLQIALNTEYEHYANSLGLTFAEQKQGPTANEGNTDLLNGDGRFRPVRYEINSSDYSDTNFLAGSNELDRNNSDADKITLQFDVNATVEDLIKQVMMSSKGVTDEASSKEDKAIFKINSFLRSTPTQVIVEYQVSRYEVITTTVDNVRKKKPVDTKSANIRIYDYIFTGKNVDIIEFDIKMDMGLSFFHTAATTSFEIDQKTGKAGSDSPPIVAQGTESKITCSGGARGKTPLFLGDKISNPKVRNKNNKVSVANFNALLQRHAALENIAVTMKIHGDPSLMSEMLVTDTTDAINAETKQTFMTSPSLIKVNIKMPTAGTNPTAFESFWYDGYYMLHSVETTFDNGEFTQILTMFSIPTTSPIQEKQDVVVATKNGATNNPIGDIITSNIDGIAEDATTGVMMRDVLIRPPAPLK